tara:strand:- start:174 stop:809 length:636 start_codon:yes stop_codon:yes gene_type:complete
MARSITFKFGADTSQLTRALGGIRKSIGGMLGGVSLGGILGAGVAGFSIQKLIGSAMNLSPTFANTMLEVEERAVRGLAAAMYEMEPQLLELADILPDLVSGLLKSVAALTTFYRSLQKDTTMAAGYFGAAFAKDMAGDKSGMFASFQAGFGTLINSVPNGIGMGNVFDPQVLQDLSDAGPAAAIRRGVGRALGASARTQIDPARSAAPRP